MNPKEKKKQEKIGIFLKKKKTNKKLSKWRKKNKIKHEQKHVHMFTMGYLSLLAATYIIYLYI